MRHNLSSPIKYNRVDSIAGRVHEHLRFFYYLSTDADLVLICQWEARAQNKSKEVDGGGESIWGRLSLQMVQRWRSVLSSGSSCSFSSHNPPRAHAATPQRQLAISISIETANPPLILSIDQCGYDLIGKSVNRCRKADRGYAASRWMAPAEQWNFTHQCHIISFQAATCNLMYHFTVMSRLTISICHDLLLQQEMYASRWTV